MYYRRVAAQKADEVELGQSLLILYRMLDEHYGIAQILIDEYDTPIQQGYTAGFYEQSVSFMRNFFFGGLNNLKINSIMDRKYSDYFGCTSDEVKALRKAFTTVLYLACVQLWIIAMRSHPTARRETEDLTSA